jgi:ParB family chromosome partitioning protein
LGHALLLAKLQPEQQEEALAACWQESYTGGSKAKRILLPVRHLREWIERNILLELATAPFSKEDSTLVPDAGSCVECPKRTGHNTLLFEGIAAKHDSCSDPGCYAAKVDAHVKQTVAAKPKLVQITTAYGKPPEGSPVVPRNQYVEIRQEKPKNKYQQDAPEYKTCKFITEAIVADGSEKGELRKVCANPDCPVHHPKKQQRQRVQADAAQKAAQEKQRREEAIANTTGIRVLAAIAEAVPVRLMKRDLLFVTERLAALVDERRLEMVAKQRGVKREKDSNSIAKLFASYLRRAEESVLGSVLVELTILLTTARQQTTQVLNEAAALYKVDTDAIAANKVKAAKKAVPKPPVKSHPKSAKARAVA